MNVLFSVAQSLDVFLSGLVSHITISDDKMAALPIPDGKSAKYNRMSGLTYLPHNSLKALDIRVHHKLHVVIRFLLKSILLKQIFPFFNT